MKQLTTYQKALAQARKLQPDVFKPETYDIYIVDSTSKPGMDYQVELGKNKINPLLDAICDCKTPWTLPCVHMAAAFLFYLSRLEERLWKGYDVITGLEDAHQDATEALALWLDLLDRYENNCNLLKAVEAGWNISEITGPIKDRLDALKNPGKELQLLLTA